MTILETSEIRIDGGTQPRLQIDMITVSEYAEAMKSGSTFPPVVVFFDGVDYWLADGFHRYHAATQVNGKTLVCDIHNGTQRDAILYSVGANATHGMRRSIEDKRRAVKTLLDDKEWSKWSSNEIARRCSVSHTFVDDIRSSYLATLQDNRKVERSGVIYEMQTSNIGRREIALPDVIEYLQENSQSEFVKTQIARAISPQTERPHVANNSGNNEWNTPPEYIAAARAVMVEIDLDPASSDTANKIVRAKKFYTEESDGLTKKWRGRVWMNPPYASELIGKFTAKLCEHVRLGDVTEAIVLVNNATEAAWFEDMAALAETVMFTYSRVKFLDSELNPRGAPLQGQAFLYFGPNYKKFIKEFSSLAWAVNHGKR